LARTAYFCIVSHNNNQVNIYMRNGTERRRRGRPPAYDRVAAVQAITGRFWRHGLSGTALDDLAAATAMSRPSLYAAFGDKAGMFGAALDAYRALAAERITAALANAPLPVALEAAFAEALAVYGTGDAHPRGCFAMTTLPAEADDPRWREALAGMIALTDAAFVDRLRVAVAAGELPTGFDCTGTGQLLASMLHSIALRSRAGARRDDLLALARAGIAVLLPPVLHGPHLLG
jgi:TetR/AcrR family transcriptional regulator, copper-responsive repressor